MTLPENIKRLLLSHVHEDRAIGISILEQIDNYRNLFNDISRPVSSGLQLNINSNGTPERPITCIVTERGVYWINTHNIYLYKEDKENCWWTTLDNVTLIEI